MEMLKLNATQGSLQLRGTGQFTTITPQGEIARISPPDSGVMPLVVRDNEGRDILTVSHDGEAQYDAADADEIIRRLSACVLTWQTRPDLAGVREKLLRDTPTAS